MAIAGGFRINTNTSATGAYRNFSKSQTGLERNIERLSSGLKINRAADDTAGLAISNRMDNQVRGLKQANRNSQQATNMIQTAEGGLNEIGNVLSRMRELAVQAASDNISDTDRDSIDLEFEELKAEITRVATSTEYNGTKLIQGNHSATADALTFQIGADNDTDNQMTLNIMDARAAEIGDGTNKVGSADLDTLTTAQTAITTLDAAIDEVNTGRSNLGAKQNRLEFTMSNLANIAQNTSASQSTIRDADFANEAADMARNQILVQSGTAMLAQANGISNNVLGLLR